MEFIVLFYRSITGTPVNAADEVRDVTDHVFLEDIMTRMQRARARERRILSAPISSSPLCRASLCPETPAIGARSAPPNPAGGANAGERTQPEGGHGEGARVMMDA